MIKPRWILFLILVMRFACLSAYPESNLITLAADPWPPFADPDAEGGGTGHPDCKGCFLKVGGMKWK